MELKQGARALTPRPHLRPSPSASQKPRAPGAAALAPAADPTPRSAGLGACALSCAAAALWIACGRFQELSNADYLMTVLNSTVRWTFFYWEQDRFGMLVALLALPVQDPLANLLLQRTLWIFSGLFAFFLLARHVDPRPGWQGRALAAACALLLAAPAGFNDDYLGAQPFDLALALGLGGLACLQPREGLASPRRWAGGFALLLLAHWVNLGAVLILGPLLAATEVVLRRDQPWPTRRLRGAWALAALLAAALASWTATRLSPHRGTPMNPLALSEWPAAWAAQVATSGEVLGGRWGQALLAAAALGVLARLAVRRAPWAEAVPSLVVIAVAAFGFASTASFRHVHENGHAWRYVSSSLALLHFAAVAFAGAALPPVRLPAVVRRVGLSAALVATSALVYGPPSPRAVRVRLDAQFGAATPDLLAANVTHVLGTYWTAWPWAFHANLVLRERGETRRLFALSHRSWATYGLWRAIPDEQMRIAIPHGDPEAKLWLDTYELGPLEEAEKRALFTVFRVAPKKAAAAPQP